MGYLEIIRPLNCIITFVSVLVGSWVGKQIVSTPAVVLAGVTGFMVCAFGNIFNDLMDIEIDKINNPGRPLPSGKVEKKYVIIFAILLFIVSLFFATSLGWLPFLFVFGVLMLLFFYSLSFKKKPYGNLIIALIAGLSFLFGGLIMKNYYALIPFVFAIFIHLSREIIKDVIDIDGDRSHKVVSIPILIGEKKSLYLSSLFLAVLCLILPLPFVLKVLKPLYMIIIGAYPFIIFIILRLLRAPDRGQLIRLSDLIKVCMVIGLVGFILG